MILSFRPTPTPSVLLLSLGLLVFSASCQQPIQAPPQIKEIPAFSMEEKLSLLIRDPAIKGHFHLTDSSVILYADTADKKNQQPEAEIFFSEKDLFLQLAQALPYDSLQSLYLQKGNKRFSEWTGTVAAPEPVTTDPLRPLAGKRVAIDPGHIGGAMSTAILEERYVKSIYQGDTLQFNEPNLNLATAYLIKEKLEKAGAEVLLTRSEYGFSSFDKTLTQWIEEDMERTIQEELDNELDPLDPFLAKKIREKGLNDSVYVHNRFFKSFDFRKRAEKINTFQPDLTFIIHYNVDSPNYEERSDDGVVPPGKDNYSMAFVPGSFMRRELKSVRSRIEFVRLLFSSNLSKSVHAADLFEQFHQKILNVDPVSVSSELAYLKRGCIYTGKPGVYARNLSLTRMVHSPLVYGESLCQDHEEEVRLLAKKEIEVHGMQMPQRIEKVADAYFQTALQFFKGI